MKKLLTCCIIMALLSHTNPLDAQFKNGDFTLGNAYSSPQVINDWTNGGAQFVPDGYVKSEDPWVDLTGTGYGNGYYIEQKVKTVKGELYYLSFDLGTFFGWDLWDAGVSITIDGTAFGGRIYHSNFTYSQDNIIYWVRMRSPYFVGTGDSMNIRFTGDSKLVVNNGWNRGVGVIALDNVSLEKYQSAGDESPNILSEVNAYPNPANTSLHVAVPQDYAGSINIELTDILGQILWNNMNIEQREDFVINTTEFKAGMYYLRLKIGENNTSVQKIVIAH